MLPISQSSAWKRLFKSEAEDSNSLSPAPRPVRRPLHSAAMCATLQLGQRPSGDPPLFRVWLDRTGNLPPFSGIFPYGRLRLRAALGGIAAKNGADHSAPMPEAYAHSLRLLSHRPFGPSHRLCDSWHGRPCFRVCFDLAQILFGPGTAVNRIFRLRHFLQFLFLRFDATQPLKALI